MARSHTVDFFDSQFRRQIEARDFALNPFEHAALPFRPSSSPGRTSSRRRAGR